MGGVRIEDLPFRGKRSFDEGWTTRYVGPVQCLTCGQIVPILILIDNGEPEGVPYIAHHGSTEFDLCPGSYTDYYDPKEQQS